MKILPSKKELLISLLICYILIAAMNKFGNDPFWSSPILRTLQDVQNQGKEFKRNNNILTKSKIVKIINGKRYQDSGWKYQASINGSEDSWSLAFEPASRPLYKRILTAIFEWEIDPKIEPVYELNSSDYKIKTIWKDGSVWIDFDTYISPDGKVRENSLKNAYQKMNLTRNSAFRIFEAHFLTSLFFLLKVLRNVQVILPVNCRL